jgi:biotin operon repressor
VDVTAAVRSTGDRLADDAMAVAFRSLLADGEPVSADSLAAELGASREEVDEAIDVLDRKGEIRRDEEGRLVAVLGLSVVPTEHVVSLGDRTVWTWCAKVALGVLGTAEADGRVESRCAETGRPVTLEFEGHRPRPSDVAVFWPSSEYASSCTSAREQLCTNINFFETEGAAEAWTARKDVPGEVLPVAEATTRSIVWARELGAMGGGSN